MRADPVPLAAVADFFALRSAARRAARGKRHLPEVAAFLCDLDREVLRLRRELLAGEYAPGPFRTFRIRDPKPRTISAAPFRDRVVHHALCAAIEPALERYAVADSYACRPGKGSHAAVARAHRFTRRFAYVLKLDVEHFFETVSHEVLLARLERRFCDPQLRQLLAVIVRAGAPGSPPGKGLPIGALTSQHFANFLLGALDHHVKQHLHVAGYVRYMDDLLLFGDARAALWAVRDAVAAFLAGELRLELKARATVLLPVSEGVPFLGLRLYPGVVRFGHSRARRFRAGLCAVLAGRAAGWLDDSEARRRLAGVLGQASCCNAFALQRSVLDRRAHAE